MIKEGNIDFVVENVTLTEEDRRLISAWIQQRKAEIKADKSISKRKKLNSTKDFYTDNNM